MGDKKNLDSAPQAGGGSNQMWGGRFAAAPDALMERINASIAFDKALYAQDIAGSVAHARMLGDAGILSGDDVTAICGGLEAIGAEIEAGEFDFRAELEDIHMNIEARLTDRIGDAAAYRTVAQRSGGD